MTSRHQVSIIEGSSNEANPADCPDVFEVRCNCGWVKAVLQGGVDQAIKLSEKHLWMVGQAQPARHRSATSLNTR
jgi:hypothetical protein